MADRREFLTFMSLAAAIGAMTPASAQSPSPGPQSPPNAPPTPRPPTNVTPKPPTLTIPSVKDISNIDNRLSTVPLEVRQRFIDQLKVQPRLQAAESNCGCNAVCRCNDNVSSCCEQKCPCNAKSGSQFANTERVRSSSAYQTIIQGLNPEEIKTLEDLAPLLDQIPSLAKASSKGSKLPEGIDDTARGLRPGTFTPRQLETYYTLRDTKGRPLPKEFIEKQFRPVVRGSK